MKFEDGDIILEKVTNFRAWYRWILAKGIQLADGVYYHHALTVSGGMVYEANEKVEVSEPLVRLRNSEILVLRLKKPFTDNEKYHFSVKLFKSLGRKYDYTGTLLFQLLYILTFKRIWLGRTGKKAERRYYCTELVADAINKVRGYFPTPWKVSPSEIIKLGPLYYDVVFEGKLK